MRPISGYPKSDTIIGSNLNIIVCDIAVTLMNRIWGLNMGCRWDRYSLHTELIYVNFKIQFVLRFVL